MSLLRIPAGFVIFFYLVLPLYPSLVIPHIFMINKLTTLAFGDDGEQIAAVLPGREEVSVAVLSS